jgi:hypothetical protein
MALALLHLDLKRVLFKGVLVDGVSFKLTWRPSSNAKGSSVAKKHSVIAKRSSLAIWSAPGLSPRVHQDL